MADRATPPAIAVMAMGAMGAAVGAQLVEHGASVVATLAGRSAASRDRADRAGMRDVSFETLVEQDMILSILPPDCALEFATKIAAQLSRTERRPVFVDCNAVSPATLARIEQVLAPTGARVVDACIIGSPPAAATSGPVFYACGPHAEQFGILNDFGLAVRVLDTPLGAASGLKMSYAGITKGLTGLAAAMIAAATRFGCADALKAELADSQPALLARFAHSLPDMLPKAYRWLGEMREIAMFAEADPATRQIFDGIALLYGQIAAAERDGSGDMAMLRHFAA